MQHMLDRRKRFAVVLYQHRRNRAGKTAAVMKCNDLGIFG
jgi:hypothetical protein